MHSHARKLLRHIVSASAVTMLWNFVSCALAQNPYAVELVAQNAAYGNQPLYNDPSAVLGEPTRIGNNNDPLIGTSPFHVNIVQSAYNVDLAGNKILTTLSRKSDGAGGFIYGSITVRFDHPIVDDPVNPYGIDFNVFGNAYYSGAGFVNDHTDMRAYTLTGGYFAEPVVVSVSPDNSNWYTYTSGPYGDTPFPTQGHAWSGEQHDLSGNGWTDQTTDFTKPVNPTLGPILTGASRPAVEAMDMYVGSGGGTGFDLAPSGFGSIQYIRVESTAQFRDGEIDGFADVRPMIVGDALSITPVNVTTGTVLHFQNAIDATHTAIRARFSSVSDLAKLATDTVTDVAALAALSDWQLLASYQLTVSALVGPGPIDFSVDYELSPGPSYQGLGAGFEVLSWNGSIWESLPFDFDLVHGRIAITDWTAPSATLAIVGLPGDFNRDGTVDAGDYVRWRNALNTSYQLSDYELWRDNYGRQMSTGTNNVNSATAPEPNLLALLLGTGILSLGSRRK